LFASIPQSLYGNTDYSTVHFVRMKAVNYVFENWTIFEHACGKCINGVDTATEYFQKMSLNGEFGYQFEINAIAKVFDCCIEVYRNKNLSETNCNYVHNVEAKEKKVIRIHLENQHYDLITEEDSKEKIPDSPVKCSASLNQIKVGSWVVTKLMAETRRRNRIAQQPRLYIGKVSQMFHKIRLNMVRFRTYSVQLHNKRNKLAFK
jgi:hypothetical protein